MKKHILPGIAAGLLALSLTSCQESFEWSPTYAVPLANGELSVGEIIGARPSDLLSDSLSNGLVTYELNYIDTLETILAASFGLNQKYYLSPPEQRVFLRMFGNVDNGYFYFTNPSVEFTFLNTVNATFDVDLENTYTENANTGTIFPFTIDPSVLPVQISAGEINNPGIGTLPLSNANTFDSQGNPGALTAVFSPTPKYLYYTPAITPTSGGLNIGTFTPIANVRLPMEGYGRIERYDTIPYNFKDSLFKFGGDEDIYSAEAGLGDFALLKMTFENGLPLQVEISGDIYNDSNATSKIASLPFYDENGDPLSTSIVVGGATQNSISPSGSPTTIPTIQTTEVRIERESSASGFADLTDISAGQAIVLKLVFYTTDEQNNSTIKIFDDQSLKFNLGIRVNGQAEFRRH